jgi:hypothetical protein
MFKFFVYITPPSGSFETVMKKTVHSPNPWDDALLPNSINVEKRLKSSAFSREVTPLRLSETTSTPVHDPFCRLQN